MSSILKTLLTVAHTVCQTVPVLPLTKISVLTNDLQVSRYGNDSLSRVFTDSHYVQRGALAFPEKKVTHSVWSSSLGPVSHVHI